jgi:hypothetical protein
VAGEDGAAMSEWQPVRIAPYDDDVFHTRKISGSDLLKMCTGKIVRVRPTTNDSSNKRFCPNGRSFQVHPDDYKVFPNYEQIKDVENLILCEHQIEAD